MNRKKELSDFSGDLKQFTGSYIAEFSAQLQNLNVESFRLFCEEIERTRHEGGIVFIAGNGGSASTASHMANDLTKTAYVEGARPIRAISVADNMSLVSAIANDISYDHVFVEQLKPLAQKKDLLVFISGSGNSPNVVKAAKWGKEQGIKTVGLLGFDGGLLKDIVDIVLLISSRQYGIVEDAHLSLNHMMTFYFKMKNANKGTK